MKRNIPLAASSVASLLLFSLILGIHSPVIAQSDEAVLEPIHRLFDGMRAGDSTAVRSAFAPIAKLVRTFSKDGVPGYRETSVDDFVKAVGTPHDAVYDEKIWDVKIEKRDNLASVWTKFAFYAGDELNHCGVNSFELANTAEGWKIIHVADTSQRENCELPPESD